MKNILSLVLLLCSTLFVVAQETNEPPRENVLTHEAVATTQEDGNIVFKFEGKKTATLVGIVKDSRTFNPIMGATVTAGEQTTYTNEHGRFKLGGFDLSETEVTVDTEGYMSQTQAVRIVGRSAAQLVFKLENQNQEEIEISEADLLKIKLLPKKVTVKAGRQFFCFFEAPDGFEREAWIGITKKDAPQDIVDPESSDNVFYHKYLLHKVQGDLLFKAPNNPGTYEMRMYNRREQGTLVSTHVLKVISQ